MLASRRLPSFALLLGFAWLLAALQLAAGEWAATAVTLPDTDDAMRLVQLREFLAGRRWFDLHEPRLGPPTGYDTHWSRLIDVGLAGLFLAFRTVAAPEQAERLTAILWPMLWLLPIIGGVAALAWRLGGRDAALIALLLATFSLPAFQQFRPGRIDHHNVQMTLAVLTVAVSVWAGRWRAAPLATGLLSGLALAIGLEGVPFVMLAGAGFALRFVLDREAARDLRVYGLTVAASTVFAFLINVGPTRWTQSVCDAIAINSTTAVAVGGLALAIVGRTCGFENWRQRTMAIVGAGLLALAAFVLIEPRCLGGIFALADPGIGPAWLNHIAEVQSLPSMMHRSLVNGLATIAFPAAALAALLMLSPGQRDPAFAIAAAAFLLALAMTLTLAKVFSYAVWFGLPFVAAALTRIRSIVPRAFAALVLTPAAIGLGAIGIGSAAGSHPIALNTPERQACVSKQGAAALAKLPPGVVLTNELEWAPYLLAFTPHSMLAAPYHRLSSTIVTAHAALARPLAEARTIMADSRIDYIAICGSRGPLGVKGEAFNASLWNHLHTNQVPDWIEPVPLEGPYTVYRVRKS